MIVFAFDEIKRDAGGHFYRREADLNGFPTASKLHTSLKASAPLNPPKHECAHSGERLAHVKRQCRYTSLSVPYRSATPFDFREGRVAESGVLPIAV